MIEQKKETNDVLRTTVETMGEFSKKLSANINNKGAAWLDKIVVHEKSDTFLLVPKIVNVTTLGVWKDEIEARLLTAPWDIKGLFIINILHIGKLLEASEAYRIRSTILSRILIDLLNKKDLNIVTSLRANVATDDGVKLLDSIRDFLLPLDNLQILDMLTNLGAFVQKNGETVEGYCARLENIFIRIKKMGYKDVNELHLAYTQRGFHCGAYGEHECLKYIQNKLKNYDLTLNDFDTSLDFLKRMIKQFTNNDVYKDGKMTSLQNHQFNRSAHGPTDSSFVDINFCLNTTKPTQEDFDKIMKHTNCPFCCLPKTHQDSYF